MSAPRFIACSVDVLERSRLGSICTCSDEQTARWLADALTEGDARGDLQPLPASDQAEKLRVLKAAIREGLDSGTSEHTVDRIMQAVEEALLEEALERWNDEYAPTSDDRYVAFGSTIVDTLNNDVPVCKSTTLEAAPRIAKALNLALER